MAAALSQQKCSCLLQQSANGVQSRPVIRCVQLGTSSTVGSRRNVQVNAKGKGAARRMAPGMAQPQMMKPQIPEVDPDNEEFCIFMRATSGNYQNWVFMSIVKGGSQSQLMVKALQNDWGQRLFSRQLITAIGESIYKERDSGIKGMRNNIKEMLKGGSPQAKLMEPMLNQPVNSFEFAFKIRDKTRPADCFKADNLTIIPKESELSSTPIDRLKAFFSPESLGSLFGGSS